MDDAYIGVIEALGFNFAPRNWAYCSGQVISISQQQTLYSLIGVLYGGDARSTFMYPDLRGRTPIGQFDGPGLTNRIIGQRIGTETTTMQVSQMPVHTHGHTYTGDSTGVKTDVYVAKTFGTVQTPGDGDFIGMPSNNFGSAPEGNLYVPENAVAAAGTVEIGGVTTTGGGGFDNSKFTVSKSGEGRSFQIMQPSLVLNYCICIAGLYPARS